LGIPPAIHLSIFIVEIGQLWYVPDNYPVNYWFGAIPHLLDKTISCGPPLVAIWTKRWTSRSQVLLFLQFIELFLHLVD
jgi:hypothetical protein